MKFYSRQLHSIEELKREKRMLSRELKTKTSKKLFSFSTPKAKKPDKTADDSPNILAALTDMVGSSGIGGSLLISILKKVIGRQLRGGVLGAVVKEFAGGYLKWKIAELAYKGIKRIIKARKERRALKNLELRRHV